MAPPAQFVNLISMVVVVVGIFILPILNITNANFMKYSFGLAVLLFVGYPFALAGHYDMYNKTTPRSYAYFPFQERVAVVIIGVLAFIYVIVAIIRR